MASRLPIWMTVDGEFTVTVVDAWLLVALSSVRLWLAVSVWPPIVPPLVFQLKVSVVAAPAASPVIVCGANGAPSGASWSVTSNAPTGWLPTFFTVTPTFTVAPWVTAAGPVTLVTATSVTGAGGGGAPPSTCTPKLLSTRSIRYAVVVGVAVDRAAGRAVAVVRGRGIAELGRVGKRDGGVDCVQATREVDGVESGERADLVGGRGAAVVGPRLQRRVADARVVAVREHVIVAEDVQGARPVHDAPADRARRDGGMPHRVAERRRPLPRRRVGERHEPSRDLHVDGHAVELARQPADVRPFHEDPHGRLAFDHCHRRADHARDAQQRVGVVPLRRDGRVDARRLPQRGGRRPHGEVGDVIGAGGPEECAECDGGEGRGALSDAGVRHE